MPRPSKYNWEAIKEAYEGGLDVKDISNKFNLEVKKINERAKLKKWIVKDLINNDINEFKTTIKKTVENGIKHQDVEEMFYDKINTIIEDNEIIGNNRKLAKAFQGLILSGVRSKTMFKTAQDIKSGVSSLKDIESMSNPSVSNKVEFNNANMQQNNTQIEIVVE
jgi:hypothetical protein